MFQRLRFLAEGENDGGTGGGAGGDADAAAKAAAEKTAADAAAKAEADKKAAAGAGDDAAAKAAAEKKAADDKAAAGKGAAKDGEYKLALPEGAKIDQARLDSFTKLAKESGITADQASKLAAFQLQQEKAASEAWAAKDKENYAALEKDPEFGGANLKASEMNLQKALKAYDAGGELGKYLESSLQDNVPALAKFLARVGKAMGEDKSQQTPDGKAAAGKILTGAERRKVMYDDMGDNKATT